MSTNTTCSLMGPYYPPGAEFRHRTDSNVRAASRTVWCLNLLRHDPLDLEKSLGLAATSSVILHEPTQTVSGGRLVTYPLDRSAAYGCRVAFAISGADAAVALKSEIGLYLYIRHRQPSSGRFFVLLYFPHLKFFCSHAHVMT